MLHSRTEIREMIKVDYSGTEYDENQEKEILTALESRRVTAEQVKDAWSTKKNDIGGRWLYSKMQDFARKHPEYAGVV